MTRVRGRYHWATRAMLLSAALIWPVEGRAQQSAAPHTSAIHGTTTTQSGEVALPGVVVAVLVEETGVVVTETVSSETGRYRITGLPAGRYRVRAHLPGFPELSRDIALASAQDLQLDLDIALALAEQVDAIGATVPVPTTGGSQDTIAGRLIDIAPVKGDDFRSLLPMLPGVVRGSDGRINMKGGRPTQTGLQLSQAYVSDPSTGDAGFDLPIDAVESVEVMPNPYAAEYGRFSSGVTRVETRRGGRQWRSTLNNFIPVPCFKICDGENLGVRSYDPRLIVGGPLVKDRLFLSQSVQAHYQRIRVPSLPNRDNDTTVTSLASFTRLDTTLGRHELRGTVAFYPRNMENVNLNTFNPAPVTPSYRQRGHNLEFVATTRFSPTTLLESTVNAKRFDVTVDGQREGPMVISPDGTQGNYFNRQERRTHTTQWVEAFRTVRQAAGHHLLKAGLDVLHLRFDGVSTSRQVEVRRADGTLSQRLDYNGPSTQSVTAFDAAAFAQDAWRLNDRMLIELGMRVDRDGVLARTNLSPRFGAVLGVLRDGRGIVRGGVGRFYERTPLIVAAFEHIEAPTVTRFGVDGASPYETRVFSNETAQGLRTPSGRVWNIEYDHRITPSLLLRVNHLERNGRHEFLVEPVESTGRDIVRLDSRGRSRYRESEVTLKFDGSGDAQAALTYVRSRSEADLNGLDSHFGTYRNPLIRPNVYSLTGIDVPHRFVGFAAWPVGRWLVAPLVEVRTGFPYARVDDDQNYVGVRNRGTRFPRFFTLDLTINREVEIRGRRARIGLRANHVLNNWTPRDVQGNTGSPLLGTFYNSIVPRFGLTFELHP